MKSARIDELKRYIDYLHTHTQEALEFLGMSDYWWALERATDELNSLYEAGYYGEAEAVYVIGEV